MTPGGNLSAFCCRGDRRRKPPQTRGRVLRQGKRRQGCPAFCGDRGVKSTKRFVARLLGASRKGKADGSLKERASPRKHEGKRHKLTVGLPADLHAKAKFIMTMRGEKITVVFTNTLEKYVKKHSVSLQDLIKDLQDG